MTTNGKHEHREKSAQEKIQKTRKYKHKPNSVTGGYNSGNTGLQKLNQTRRD